MDSIVLYYSAIDLTGHSSPYGIGYGIEVLTGLFIDFTILSLYCQACVFAANPLRRQTHRRVQDVAWNTHWLWRFVWGHRVRSGRNFVITKLISEDGRLTHSTITKLTGYYGKAIHSHCGDKDAMGATVFATLFHSMSTDDDPHHSQCPVGRDSWCFLQPAEAPGEKPGS